MEIQETMFNSRTYLAVKKLISTDQISDKNMYDQAGQKLGAYIAQHNLKITGPWSVIYFTWNEEVKKTDIAIAFPVTDLTSVDDSELSVVSVAESKASMGVLEGSYEGLGAAHQELMAYTKEHNLQTTEVPVLAVEEYVVGPMENQDPSSWKTNIYYLHR